MNPLIYLAKQAVETFIGKGKIIPLPAHLPKEFLERRAGTFVTIEKNNDLRSCIGTYLPTKENIAREIISNAIAAATEDYRFGPIQKEELPELSYTVYILNEPELVKDIKELDPKKFGIIIRTVPISSTTDVVFNGHFVPKSALLLPDLEGIDTVENQISIACQKGGIDPMREKTIIYKFTVEKYDE
ncbi:AmmeMemoRadiSam system protein A [bacterium (Candidatus Gribaldobacteria) CG_4_9_14_3_um_filter_33_9]|nr:MAG: AmmeMemoRadiSam system protein A [bacterium (Candidatus Gribaldobacteria) CG_4_9_14_3_um_filter_33_9]